MKKDLFSPSPKKDNHEHILRMNFLNRRTSTISNRRSSLLGISEFNTTELNPNQKQVLDEFMKGVGLETS